MKNITQWQRTTLLAAGISMSMISTLHAAAPVLYELHSTGSVWGYTGTPCNGKVCSGWEMLDDERTTVQIAAGNGALYQRHTDGSVWQWNGAVCNGNACNRWTQIGAYATNILAAGPNVYLYNQNGLWQFNGEPCTNPNTCPGWIGIDSDPEAIAYYVQDYTVVKIRSSWEDGADEFFQYTCSNTECSGVWVLFGTTPFGSGPPLALAPGLAAVYEVSSNGFISVYGQPCLYGTCTWAQIGDHTNTVQITAGNNMYQLQSNGAVLQYTGTPCNGASCNGWLQLDQTPAISYIVAGPNTVYEQHKDGSIWQYTGPCNFCLTGWTELDNNPLTVSVVPGY